MKNKRVVASVLFCILLGGGFLVQESPQRKKLPLQLFFEELLFHQDGGYTIFGNKPLSLISYYKNSSGFHSPKHEDFFLSHYQAFSKQYGNPFHSRFYWIKGIEYSNRVVIYIANKKALVDILETNLALFQKAVGPMTADEICSEFLSSETTFSKITRDKRLLGILLGYGEGNCERYQCIQNVLFSFPQNCLLDEKKYNACVKEVEHLSQWPSIASLYPDNPLSPCGLPMFYADPSTEESKDLAKEYVETHKKLIELYSQEDWLDTVLIQLVFKKGS